MIADTRKDAQKKEAVMNGVRQEVAAANAKELVDNMTEKCYSKCVTKPGTALTGSEEVCFLAGLRRVLSTHTNASHLDLRWAMYGIVPPSMCVFPCDNAVSRQLNRFAVTAVTTTYRTRLGKERLAEMHTGSSSF